MVDRRKPCAVVLSGCGCALGKTSLQTATPAIIPRLDIMMASGS